jgi:enamine deaminase RidA (YjgF/YER057c/UK114 family)
MRTIARTLPLAALLAGAALATPAALSAQARIITGRGSAMLSNAVRVGDLVFASGALPARGANADTTIEGQTTSTLESIKRTLETAGTSINNAVKCTVFLISGTDFQGMNTAYQKFWSAENPPPARTTVVVQALVVPGAKLEIECIAAMPKP